MPQKRLRIFAGPNGSGKSSLLKMIPDSVPLGFYINADNIEKLIARRRIKLKDFGIEPDTNVLHSFFDTSDFVTKKANATQLKATFNIQDDILVVEENKIPSSYAAAIIADFLRQENLKAGKDFSFETVMSDESKIKFIRNSNKHNYHVYLYYVCTADVLVNVERVKARVLQGGHPVPEIKIRDRYFRSLDLLYDAIKNCYKSYLFDNSDKMELVAQVNRDGVFHQLQDLPNWVIEHVIKRA
jgi:predicted ABC-type ATPase